MVCEEAERNEFIRQLEDKAGEDRFTVYSCLMGGHREERDKILGEHTDRTRCNGHMLQQGQFCLDIRKNYSP